MGPLLLADPDSLLRWAWHAHPRRVTRDGLEVAAVHAVAHEVLGVLERARPSRLLAAWDSPPPTWRHQAYPGYQAQHPPEDPALSAQRPLAEALLTALGFVPLRLAGWAARDLIASAAAGWGGPLRALSADRDLCQLVSGQFTLLAARVGGVETYDPAQVRARYGVEPAQWAAAQALVGDKGNEVAGLPGVGPKTAADLLTAQGDLEGVLAAARRGAVGGRRGQVLRDGAAAARAALEVVRIRADAPLEIPPGGWPAPAARAEEAARLLAAWECGDLLRRLTPRATAAPSEIAYHLIADAETARQAAEALLAARVVGVARCDDPPGLALSPARGRAWLAPTAWRAQVAAPLLEGRVSLVGHDVTRLADLAPRAVGDTAVAWWLLQPERPGRALEDLARRWLGLGGEPEPEPEPWRAACRGADWVRRLEPLLRTELESAGLLGTYRRRELPLAAALAELSPPGGRTQRPCGRVEPTPGPWRLEESEILIEAVCPDLPLRLLAELSGDRGLRAALQRWPGQRAAACVAAVLADREPHQVSEAQRQTAAALNAAAARGGDTAWLGRRLGCDAAAAERRWAAWAAAFPAVGAWQRQAAARGRRGGWLRTLGGRRLAGGEGQPGDLGRALLEAAVGDWLGAALVAWRGAAAGLPGRLAAARPSGWVWAVAGRNEDAWRTALAGRGPDLTEDPPPLLWRSPTTL
jgi:5'-3' exonuclease